jgi:hypothetical protein
MNDYDRCRCIYHYFLAGLFLGSEGTKKVNFILFLQKIITKNYTKNYRLIITIRPGPCIYIYIYIYLTT